MAQRLLRQKSLHLQERELLWVGLLGQGELPHRLAGRRTRFVVIAAAAAVAVMPLSACG